MMATIVRVANFVTPTSGGIRTVLRELGVGYLAHGHDVHLVVPRPRDMDDRGPVVTDHGVVHTLPGVTLPGSGGYRLIVARRPARELLERLRPDAVEVSDRWTLGWVADWARARGVRSTVTVHDRADALLAAFPDVVARHVVPSLDQRMVAGFDRVAVPSRHAAAPLPPRTGVQVVAHGVDLDVFTPAARAGVRPPGPLRLVTVARLSREKQPGMALDVVARLRARGCDVTLDMVGAGPLASHVLQRIRREALPVRWHGHIAARPDLVALLRHGDLGLATCPVEAFGLSALEMLACGLPVVGPSTGGVAELLDDDCGRRVGHDATAYADGVLEVVSERRAALRDAARTRAEAYPWHRAVAAMLHLHGCDADPVESMAGSGPGRQTDGVVS